MILLDSYYVSEKLVKTIKDLNISICKINDFYLPNEENLVVLSNEQFVNRFKKGNIPILANSESALMLLNKYLPNERLTYLCNLFKNKEMFRASLSKLYPEFFYKKLSIEELLEENTGNIQFPVILKPTIGYSSVGVYYIENENQYFEVVNEIEKKYQFSSSAYSKAIINTDSFILEQYIEGEEFAVDTYYNNEGDPVILNIFSRMFANKNDISDRIYYTSKLVLKRVMKDIEKFLRKLGDIYHLKNIPLHIELRVRQDGFIIPIEVNPLRFAGIGTTELGYYAYNINSYEFYFDQKKPNWDQIINNMDDQIYSFCCAEYDFETDGHLIETIDHAKFQSYFDDILEYRIMPYKDYTTFAVIFFRSPSMEQNNTILQLDLQLFISEKKLQLIN